MNFYETCNRILLTGDGNLKYVSNWGINAMGKVMVVCISEKHGTQKKNINNKQYELINK
jgi:hypothetical protein